jgi:hypothetical protein
MSRGRSLRRIRVATGTLHGEVARSPENHDHLPRVRADFTGGVRSGVNGTPTFFIKDQRHNGPFDYENLLNAIEETPGAKGECTLKRFSVDQTAASHIAGPGYESFKQCRSGNLSAPSVDTEQGL